MENANCILFDRKWCNQLIAILKNILKKLSSIGFKALATVCDQNSVNRFPHLIISITNNLLYVGFIHNENRIYFKDIRDVYLLDKSSTTSRALPQITEAHINPNNFQKMNVKLTVNIFSNSIYAAIKTAFDQAKFVQKPPTQLLTLLRLTMTYLMILTVGQSRV